MITPINSHVVIEPEKSDSFISQGESFEEIGVVIDYDRMIGFTISGNGASMNNPLKVGSRVYFDSWMAAKFPKNGSKTEFYWLVKYEDIRAIENDIEPIPQK